MKRKIYHIALYFLSFLFLLIAIRGEAKENDIFYFTEDTDYSQIQRVKYENIDWSKYGSNGILDEGQQAYLSALRIDAKSDEAYGSKLEKLQKRNRSLRMVRSAESEWAVGSVHTGMCDITSSWFVPSEGQSYFTLGNFRSGLEGVEMIGYGWCADHTAAEPPKGHKVIEVRCTVTRVDTASGWVYMSLLLTPDGVTDGVTHNAYGLIGYQHVAANVRVKKSFSGYANLKKESANPEITTGSSCYSLAGAEYGVYSDSSCKNQVDTFTTDEDGDSSTIMLAAGKYYVKEITAPKGFVLDKRTYPVTVTAGETTTVSVTDIPTMDPVGILLGKVDKETNQNKPYGSLSLQGALFEAKFYDGLYDSNPAEQGVKEKRSWIFETNEKGFCYYNKDYLKSGDELYWSTDGNPSLPIGTLTIQEVQAPEGYLLNPQVFVIPITSENDGSEFVNTYNEPTIPEALVMLQIQKKIKGKEIPIPGVVFEHVKPDGSTETVEMDEQGVGVLRGLNNGTHLLRESSVPDGFTKNPGEITFLVEQNGKIIPEKDTSTEEFGTITLKPDSIGGGSVVIEDRYVPYRLQLVKNNEHGEVLEGAKFGVYTDPDCTKPVQVGETDEKGMLTVDGLQVESHYYVKELQAPVGYRIPLNEDGKIPVYEFYTESNPMKDSFLLYVNGTAYEGTEGAYHVGGTKANREVTLTIVNQTGIQMPETGSPWTLGILLVGMSLLGGFILFNRKERKKE